jgi:hypothetical protein
MENDLKQTLAACFQAVNMIKLTNFCSNVWRNEFGSRQLIVLYRGSVAIAGMMCKIHSYIPYNSTLRSDMKLLNSQGHCRSRKNENMTKKNPPEVNQNSYSNCRKIWKFWIFDATGVSLWHFFKVEWIEHQFAGWNINYIDAHSKIQAMKGILSHRGYLAMTFLDCLF